MPPLQINDDGTLPYARDERGKPYLIPDVEEAIVSAGGPHDHDADYSALDHDHGPGGDHPDLATHEGLGLVTDADLTTHAGTAHGTQAHAIGGASHTGNLTAADVGAATSGHNHDGTYEASGAVATHAGAGNPHPTYLTQAEGDGLYSASGHSHGGGSEAYGVGDLYLTTVNHANAAAVATHHGYGTWARFGAGRFLLLSDTSAGTEAGSATHAHSFTQPSDHGALSHSGATVGNHAFTQPNAHSDHAALSHSAHAGATVGNHTDVTNHVHVINAASSATGGLVGSAPDTSTNTSVATGYSTANPTSVGVAAMVHTVGQASAHSDHAAQSHSAHAGGAVDAHTVGQASNHAAQSHANGAVANGSTDPLSITAFAWQRTA